MGLVKKSITITEQQEEWLRAQIASGAYGNDSEYIRALIRRDQGVARAQFEELKAAIREGLESGGSKRTVSDIWNDVEARLRADGRL
jgi:antitoxin ParD1/3/4